MVTKITTKATTDTTGINSNGINAIINMRDGEIPEMVGSVGEGDAKITLYRWSDGFESIDTNGDPVNEMTDGFDELKTQILGD